MSISRCTKMSKSVTIKNYDIRNCDVRDWYLNNFYKLSIIEVCQKFGIDVTNDRKNNFLLKIQLDKRVVITDDLLNWLGYSNQEYWKKRKNFNRLLQKNSHIPYNEITDEMNARKKYFVLDTLDFESLMMQMRNDKVIVLRELFSLLKMIVVKYNEYENYFEKKISEMLKRENNDLIRSVNELKSLVLTVKLQGEDMYRRSEEERRRAVERERLADQEICRADEERWRAEERARFAEERINILMNVIKTNEKSLRTNIAPLVVPTPKYPLFASEERPK